MITKFMSRTLNFGDPLFKVPNSREYRSIAVGLRGATGGVYALAAGADDANITYPLFDESGVTAITSAGTADKLMVFRGPGMMEFRITWNAAKAGTVVADIWLFDELSRVGGA